MTLRWICITQAERLIFKVSAEMRQKTEMSIISIIGNDITLNLHNEQEPPSLIQIVAGTMR